MRKIDLEIPEEVRNWIGKSEAPYYYVGLYPFQRLHSKRAILAIDEFRMSQAPPLKRSDVVLYVPQRAWQRVNWYLMYARKEDRKSFSGITICVGDELRDNAIAMKISDVESGRAPRASSYLGLGYVHVPGLKGPTGRPRGRPRKVTP